MTTVSRTLEAPAHAPTQIAERVFTLAGQQAMALAPLIDTTRGGLVLSGKRAFESVSAMRRLHRDVPLLIEPKAHLDHFATADNPFGLVSEGELFAASLNDVLDGQIQAGASLAITPTGFMAAGNADPLKAAIEEANKLDRADTLVMIPVDTRWCKEPAAAQLGAVLRRSRHPVALTLTGRSGNPWAESGVVATIRRLSAEIPNLVLWRCDLVGFDGMAHGATAIAMGSIASQRRAFKPGEKGFRSDATDQSPHVLVEPLLRYSRGRHMYTRWFSNHAGLSCTCPECGGRRLDRFIEASMTPEALRHNQYVLNQLVGKMPSDPTERKSWWFAQVQSAIQAHAVLSAETQVKIGVPADIKAWAKASPDAVVDAGSEGRTQSH